MANTPYDDVFRTLLNDCSRLVLPLLNEAFGEHYKGTEEITFLQNEHFLNQKDGQEDKRITDTFFEVSAEEKKKYHWECESGTDRSILARFFEYDAQIALDSGKIEEGVLVLDFPNSAVLELRAGKSIGDKMRTRINTPGGTVEYDTRVVKMKSYSWEELFEKDLLFLLPFYIFNHERELEECESDEEKLNNLEREYQKIKIKLEELKDKGFINEYTKCTLMDMSSKVAEHIAAKYSKVRERVKKIMVGQVLDYEAKRIRNQGIEEGIEKGIEEGIRTVIIQMNHKGLSIPEITDITNKDKSEIKDIIDNGIRIK